MRRRPWGVAVAAAVTLPAVLLAPHSTSAQTAVPEFGAAVNLPSSDGGTEPRVTVTPDGRRWVISNKGGTAVVYGSTDGVHWAKTASDPADQVAPSIDVDIAATRTGRLIATELDFDGPAIITSYSDDDGATWTASSFLQPGTPLDGTELVDQDRPWLAVGPDDPTTHQPRVYMLMHNLFSGAASHNMYVFTSTDGGATFGPPIPTTLPGSQAWLDLQCADSGGPSNLVVNQTTGQVYAVFGTRSSAAGGCGASVTGSFEINVVAATRVWVATAPAGGTGDPTQWTQQLAVDDNTTGRIVGMQLAPGALDNAGNMYIFYPESPNAYPDYDGAALRYMHAPADLSSWSQPVTVAPSGGAGHLLPHIVAGDPGKLDFAYFTGEMQASGAPLWYATAAQTLDGLSASPHIVERRLSRIATYEWTASQMMGACGSGPTQGIKNGFNCPRSTDVWGIALNKQCRAVVTWPVQSATSGGETPDAKATQGTYVAEQGSGPALCSPAVGTAGNVTAAPTPAAAPSPTPTGAAQPVTTLPNTSANRTGAGLASLAVAAILAGIRRRRRRAGDAPAP
jgi:hypothetical protein